MDLCLIFRREKLGIFCFLLLLENKSLESIVLNIGNGIIPICLFKCFFFFEEKLSFGLRVCQGVSQAGEYLAYKDAGGRGKHPIFS